MADNVVKAMNARSEAMDRVQRGFDERRGALMRQMSDINQSLIDLQAEQNAAFDALMKEHDAAQAKAREADLAEEADEAAKREKKSTVPQQAQAKAKASFLSR